MTNTDDGCPYCEALGDICDMCYQEYVDPMGYNSDSYIDYLNNN